MKTPEQIRTQRTVCDAIAIHVRRLDSIYLQLKHELMAGARNASTIGKQFSDAVDLFTQFNEAIHNVAVTQNSNEVRSRA